MPDPAAPLQAALDAAVARGGAPSALLRVDAPAWCFAGGAGADPATPFRAASVTKTVTTAAALALAERGAIDLDRPIGDVLEPHALGPLPAAGAATPRQLLGHTAGLPDYYRAPGLKARLAADPVTPLAPSDLLALAATAGGPAFPPGTGFAYSDTGYVVAGLAIEQAAGMPLHAAYRELVLDPLGLDATYLEGHEPARGATPARNLWADRDMSAVTPTFDWAGGGLVTTTADLVDFVRGLWAGRLVGRESIAAMTAWNPAARFDPDGGPQYERYGLGLGSNTVRGVELVGHTGFWGTFAYWAPAHEAALAGTVNASRADRMVLVEAACLALAG